MEGHLHRRHRETFSPPATLLSEVAMLGWCRFLAADRHFGPHAHPEAWEICYIVRGNLDWWAGDRVFAIGPGDVYLTRPNEPHGGVDALMQPGELYWIQVRPGKGKEWQHALRRLASTRRRVFRGTPAVPEIFERLMEEHRKRGPDAPAVCRAWMLALVLEAVRAHDAAAKGGRAEVSPAMARALAYLQAHVEEAGLEEAAKAAGLGLSQFHDRFAEETGYSPGEYRSRLRVERAKGLLLQKKASVTRIALALGFSSSQYFATSFRKYTGMSPRQFRRQITSSDVSKKQHPE